MQHAGSRMKNSYPFILLIILVFITSSRSFPQSGKVPPFQMMLHNGKIFRARNLPFGKPIIIVYFSPECEECHQFTEGLLKNINDFRNASIAMITYMSPDKVKQYVSDFKLEQYPNIYAGTEGNTLFVLNYYRISKFPFVALYNKDGGLIKKYNSTEVDLTDLIRRVKGL